MKYYAEDVIAKNMLSQVDDEGYSTTLINSVVEYKRYVSAVYKADKYIFTRIGHRRLRKTTQGWKLIVACKDGSKTCITLKYIKE